MYTNPHLVCKSKTCWQLDYICQHIWGLQAPLPTSFISASDHYWYVCGQVCPDATADYDKGIAATYFYLVSSGLRCKAALQSPGWFMRHLDRCTTSPAWLSWQYQFNLHAVFAIQLMINKVMLQTSMLELKLIVCFQLWTMQQLPLPFPDFMLCGWSILWLSTQGVLEYRQDCHGYWSLHLWSCKAVTQLRACMCCSSWTACNVVTCTNESVHVA